MYNYMFLELIPSLFSHTGTIYVCSDFSGTYLCFMENFLVVKDSLEYSPKNWPLDWYVHRKQYTV